MKLFGTVRWAVVGLLFLGGIVLAGAIAVLGALSVAVFVHAPPATSRSVLAPGTTRA